MGVHEGNGGRQPVIVVNDELQVGHGLIALVCQSGMLHAFGLLGFVHVVHYVRHIAQVDVQP